ncbi:MAG: transporter substrate-binding domain-containing protein [Lachnospiraceae bacterium]|nr:transporter substrate-binding domain-containing protein [Lachnospiraceae bacterium]
MTISVRIRFIITGLILGVSLLTGCGAKDGGTNKESVNSLESADSTASVSDINGKKQPITSLNRLAQPGVTIAVSQDTPAEASLKQDYPGATLIPYSDIFLAYLDVVNGRVDACVSARREMEFALDHGLTGVRLLEETYETNRIAVGISPATEIPDLKNKLNSFIAEVKADGTLDDMYDRWVMRGEETMPDIPRVGNPSFTLRVGTTGTVMPYSYYAGTELTGYDIELARRFAYWLGAGLEFKVYDFGGIIPAAEAGSIDCIMSNLFYTEEKEESIPFSDVLFEVEITAMVKDNEQPELTEFSELSGKTVSMLTGAPFEELVKSKAPDVGEFTFFNSTPDMIEALKTQKTDAFLMNNAVSQLVLNRNPDLALFPQNLQDGEFGIAFAKGDTRRDEWQAAYDSIPEPEIEAAWEKWTGADDSVKTLPEQDWPGTNGTVRVAACDTLEPMSYVGGDGELRGFDLEVILMAARKLDVKVEFTGMEFSAILAAVQSGKADMGAGSIIITDERAEAVDFLEYYPAAFVLIVRTVTTSQAETSTDDSILNGIRDSFDKTFIREDRWKLFLDGVLTTLLITLLAILFGTLLGFGVFMLCRNGNPVATTVTRFCLWLVQGMPMVVLLMILYYIIFGSVSISGTAVAVIGFTLTFGAAVFGLLKMGVGAIDIGQYEAAYALGYSNHRTFFTIILPQALPHVLPAYKGEIVGLIKATAIVGYIAVQDLTKMGDIVRSRTYEAFFPLIAVTIIYFILEGLIGFFVNKISINMDPKRRMPSDILKGVKIDD